MAENLWLSIRYFDTSLQCVTALREEQPLRKIWCMDLAKDAMEMSIDIIDEYRSRKQVFPHSVALVMGKEAEGPSTEFLEHCHRKVYLSQFGFCESFNVSVACALGLQSLFSMKPSMRGLMDEAERNRLRFLWYSQLVNDDQLKLELKALADADADANPVTESPVRPVADGQTNDFRRNEFTHWDKKKINSQLRRRLEQKQKDDFLIRRADIAQTESVTTE